MSTPIKKEHLALEHRINVQNQVDNLIKEVNSGLIYKGIGTTFVDGYREEVIEKVKEAFLREGYIVQDVPSGRNYGVWTNGRLLEVHVSIDTINAQREEARRNQETKQKPWWKIW